MTSRRKFGLVLLTVVSCWLGEAAVSYGETIRFYVGTYTNGPNQGIYLSEINTATGAMKAPELAAEAVNPAFLAIHPAQKLLYAVNEISDFQGKKVGGISGYAIDSSTGKLTLINQQPSMGAGPCHLTVDPAGKCVLVANYGGGTVAALKIDPDGKLAPSTSFIQHAGSSVNKQRQEAPHAHSINVDPSKKFAVACDLGLDQVLVYQLNAEKAEIKPNTTPFVRTPTGGGPRHLAFHPQGKYVFVNNELDMTVTAYSFDSIAGTLMEIHTVPTLSAEDKAKPGNSTAEVVVHPSGKFVYVSNRGHGSIAVFTVDEATGRLTPQGQTPSGGKVPRNFAVDPTGKYLLAENQDNGAIVAFAIDPQTGQLQRTPHEIKVDRAVCIKFWKSPN